MAPSIEVKCINKSNRPNTHERIQFIGGTKADGTRWKISQKDAIDGIESGKWAFHVGNTLLSTVKVIVSTSASRNKYIKTENDGEQPNNLLSLPECP